MPGIDSGRLDMTHGETEVVEEVLLESLEGYNSLDEIINDLKTEEIISLVDREIELLEETDNEDKIHKADVLRDANFNMMAHEGLLQ